jgi:alpha-tubulin suppressor-like RCC1 family protein
MPNILPMMMSAAGAGGGTANTPFPDSYVFGWGAQDKGALMLGNTTIFSSPVQIGGKLYRAFAMGASGYPGAGNTGAVDTDGKLFTCGNAADGALGDGTTTDKSSPVQIGSATDWGMVATAGAGPGRNYTTAAKTDGTLWSWGNNENGCLGQNNLTDICSPVQIGSLTDWFDGEQSYENMKRVAANANKSCFVVKSDGTLWAWGDNAEGQLGTSNLTTYSSPVQIGSNSNWNMVDGGTAGAAGAINNDGELYTWGSGRDGQRMDGALGDTSVPAQVGSSTNWTWWTSSGSSSAAINSAGQLFTCGNNSDGELGLGNTTDYSSPVQVGSLTDWKYIQCVGNNMLAVKTDGTLWNWGAGNYAEGNIRPAPAAAVCSPVQIGSRTDWIAPIVGLTPSGAFNSAT